MRRIHAPVESGPLAWATVIGHHQGGSHVRDHEKGIANVTDRRLLDSETCLITSILISTEVKIVMARLINSV